MQIIMKKIIYLSLPLIMAVVLNSCLTSESDIQETPLLSVTAIRNSTDTLKIYTTTETNTFRLDTVAVGDSILFFTVMYSGRQNRLTEFKFDFDAEIAEIHLKNTEKLDSIFSPKSDYEKGLFVVNVEANYIWLPVIYIPKTPSSNTTVSFTVKSNSKYSPTTVKLKTPIKAKSK